MENTGEGRQDAAPNIDLGIDDATLLQTIKDYIERFHSREKELKITDRREKNRKYLFGKQLEGTPTKKGQKKLSDNIILDSQDSVKGLVLSRLPDLLVNGSGSERSIMVAEGLTKLVNKKLNQYVLKNNLGRAFEHLPADLIACLKYRWDPHAGRSDQGDYVLEFVMPENIIFDSSVIEADEKKMRMIIHKITDKTTKEWISMFPQQEEIILKEAKAQFKGKKDNEVALMGFEPEVQEVWFDWFEKDEDFDAVNNPKYKFDSGLSWRMGENILDKMRNPNWDWDGETRFFLEGDPVPDEVLAEAVFTNPEVLQTLEQKQVFKNYFKRPRKPFIFMSDRQWGDSPWEKTSSIEQNIPLQDNYDDRMGTISYMLAHARVKNVFGGGIKKETIEKLDFSNPDQDIVLESSADLRTVYTFIQGQLPPAEAFADLDRTKNRIFSRVNVNAATRGEIVSNTATTNQIAREGDYAQQDDLADDTISPVSQDIAESYLHMVKLRAEPEYFQEVLGDDAENVQERFTADDIEDGMIVEIEASTTDKLKAERSAKEEAQLKLIDPINYYKDTGRKNPERRAMMVTVFQVSPALYLKKYGQGQDIQQIAQEAMMFNRQKEAQAAGANGQPGFGQGNFPAESQNPSPQNPGNVATNPGV